MKWNLVKDYDVPVHRQTVLIQLESKWVRFGFYDKHEEKWYYIDDGNIKPLRETVIKWSYKPTREELLEEEKELTPVERAMNIMIEMDKLSNQCASNLDFDKSRKVARAFTYMSKTFIREIITLARGGK